MKKRGIFWNFYLPILAANWGGIVVGWHENWTLGWFSGYLMLGIASWVQLKILRNAGLAPYDHRN